MTTSSITYTFGNDDWVYLAGKWVVEKTETILAKNLNISEENLNYSVSDPSASISKSATSSWTIPNYSVKITIALFINSTDEPNIAGFMHCTYTYDKCFTSEALQNYKVAKNNSALQGTAYYNVEGGEINLDDLLEPYYYSTQFSSYLHSGVALDDTDFTLDGDYYRTADSASGLKKINLNKFYSPMSASTNHQLRGYCPGPLQIIYSSSDPNTPNFKADWKYVSIDIATLNSMDAKYIYIKYVITRANDGSCFYIVDSKYNSETSSWVETPSTSISASNFRGGILPYQLGVFATAKGGDGKDYYTDSNTAYGGGGGGAGAYAFCLLNFTQNPTVTIYLGRHSGLNTEIYSSITTNNTVKSDYVKLSPGSTATTYTGGTGGSVLEDIDTSHGLITILYQHNGFDGGNGGQLNAISFEGTPATATGFVPTASFENNNLSTVNKNIWGTTNHSNTRLVTPASYRGISGGGGGGGWIKGGNGAYWDGNNTDYLAENSKCGSGGGGGSYVEQTAGKGGQPFALLFY